MTYKVDTFEKEIGYVKDEKIKQFLIESIETMPDYFFEISSSSTNKYHPNYALGNGGLTRHVKAATRLAIEMFRLDWWKFTSEEEDLILVSLILHDGWKSGVVQTKYTVTEHPIIAVEELSKNEWAKTLLTKDQFDFVSGCISRHMGQFTNDYKTGKEILEKPVTKFEKFVHLIDYIVSRKCLEFNFDVEIER